MAPKVAYGPGEHVAVVVAALLSFALVTTVAVVALGVTPVAEAVPDSPDPVPAQPGDALEEYDPTSESTANATVSGAVTAPNGSAAANATVALAPSPEPMFEKATPEELAAVLDAEASSDLYVAETDADGRYEVAVPEGSYDVIALADRNVSEVRTVNATGNETVDLAVREARSIEPDVTGSQGAAGERANVTVRFYNNDATAKTFDVEFTDLPRGWTVDSHGGNADEVDADARAFHFENLSSGAWAIAQVTVRVPENATPGEAYSFAVMATTSTEGEDAMDRVVWTGNATVVVPDGETATTTTYVDEDDQGTTAAGTTRAATEETVTEDGPATLNEAETATTSLGSVGPGPNSPGRDVPGFGVALAVGVLVVAAVVLGGRTRR